MRKHSRNDRDTLTGCGMICFVWCGLVTDWVATKLCLCEWMNEVSSSLVLLIFTVKAIRRNNWLVQDTYERFVWTTWNKINMWTVCKQLSERVHIISFHEMYDFSREPTICVLEIWSKTGIWFVVVNLGIIARFYTMINHHLLYSLE